MDKKRAEMAHLRVDSVFLFFHFFFKKCVSSFFFFVFSFNYTSLLALVSEFNC